MAGEPSLLLKAPEVARLLSMDAKTFARLREHERTFPKPIMLGRAGKGQRIGARLRWRREEVLAWILMQPRSDLDPDDVEEGDHVQEIRGNKGI